MIRLSDSIVAGLFLGLALLFPWRAEAIDIQRVVSPGGIVAWLVEDRKVPVIAVDFAFESTGSSADPAGKPGVANLMASLLDEGAGERRSQEFQKLLADNSISISFSAGRDEFRGAMKALTVKRDLAIDLLSQALTQPRFDAEAVERIRLAVMANIKSNQASPNWIAQRTFSITTFGGHPYSQPSDGTLDSVQAITTEDMRDYLGRRLGRDNLVVGVVGDVSASELAPMLDRMFGALPAKAERFIPPEAALQAAGDIVLVPRPLPQTVFVMGEQGVKRSDPDWYAASVMNYVLGGGGFNSRLMEEVREKRGLTYGVSSSLVPYDHAALITAGGSTVNAKAGEALDLIRVEWRRMAVDGVTDEELKNAKAYLTGSFALRLTSTDRIASMLVQVQLDDLGIDYLNKRDEFINRVSRADVLRVARRLLDPAKLTIVMVGQPKGIEPTRTIDGPPG
jgi:zinc protease